MKKIFTLAAAVLASVSLMAAVPAETLNPANVPADGWAGKYAPAYIESGDWVCFSPYEIYQSSEQTWAAAENSSSTSATWDAIVPFPAQSAWTTNDGRCATVRENTKGPYYYRITNTTDVAILAKSGSAQKRTVYLRAYELTDGVQSETAIAEASMEANENAVISISELDAAKEYLIIVSQIGSGSKGASAGNSNFMGIAFKTIMSTDPVLSVSPATVDLAVTAAKASDEAVVKFTGKNLAEGTYNLTIPAVAGLTVTPASVTVGADGKLNAEVTIAYASTVDVAAASTAVSLTIGELTQSVTVNYSAVLAKQYLNASLNIEQLVLDNGLNYSITDAFAAANIEYANLDQLDSLNDEKPNRNYPYLGLKLKKADAKLACWLQSGHSVKVRFGNVGADFLVRANGVEQTLTAAEYANTSVESANVFSVTATEDTYLEIICNSTKTLVIKQIMLDAEIQAVTLPEPLPTGINNAEEAVKAVKVIRNGQLFIEKNGVLFNAQGAVVK